MNLGQANTALPKLKELTDRAGVSAPSSVTADYLLEERSRELMWEGHRRTDLILSLIHISVSVFLVKEHKAE